MAKLSQITSCTHPRYSFKVIFKQGGKRHLRYFTTRSAATAFSNLKDVELLNEGRKQGEITDDEKSAILQSRKMAEQLLAVGIRDFSLQKALEHYAAHLEAFGASVKALAAYDQFRAAKERENASKRYLDDISSRIQSFAKAFKRKLVCEITESDVEKYINKLGLAPVTIANHHRMVSVFLEWCVKRRYATMNAAARFTPPRASNDEPGILSVEQTAALLDTASARIMPALAVGLFAGLRQAEIGRLDWSNVDFEHKAIVVTARSSKTKRRRVVSMPANLVEWLRLYARQAGKLAPSPQVWRADLKLARTAAGIAEWPHNAARHSAASYGYDKHQNAALVAAQLGHDVGMLETNYKGLVRPGDGDKYFGIEPPKPADNVIQMHSVVA